jgi:hypothetical protein
MVVPQGYLHNFHYVRLGLIKKGKMGGICSRRERNEKYEQNSGWKTLSEATT